MTLRFQCGQISDFEAVAGGDILELPIGGFLPSSYYGGLIWMMIALAAILLAFCWFIPLLFVNRMMKKTTVERLRQN